jgi:hypothetical protein
MITTRIAIRAGKSPSRKFNSGITRLRGLVSVLLAVSATLIGHAAVADALVNSYFGTGYFPTNNLNRCHSGGYSTESQNASARWSSDTDLNMYYNCTNTHITTRNASWGNTGWAGLAVICSVNGQCNLSGNPYDSTYQSCTARLNQWAFNNNPGFYTSAEIQKLATHELGHCYSLDHATNPSVMNNSSVPESQDISLINYRY